MSEVDVVVPVKPRNSCTKPLFSCLMAVVAALATWGALKAKHPFFTIPGKYNIGMGASNEARYALLSQQARVEQLTATVTLAMGGFLLSGVLALVANGCCSFPIRLLIALPWGAVVGAASGFIGSMAYSAIIPLDSFPNITNTGLTHAVVFAMFGAGLGMLYGGFSYNKQQAITATVIGASAGGLGGLLFPFVTGLAMPQQSIVGLVQTSIVGTLWLGLPFAAIGFAVPSMSNR